MPVPMRMDDALRLCGGSGFMSIQARMELKFGVLQSCRRGTWVDRERLWLVGLGGKAGGSRYDLWRKYVSSGRPFTDGIDRAASLTAFTGSQSWVGVGLPADRLGGGRGLAGECGVEAGYVRRRVVRRLGEGAVGVVEVGGVYSFTAG